MMADGADTEDKEFEAMGVVISALKGLDDDASRMRVLAYAGSRWGIGTGPAPQRAAPNRPAPTDASASDDDENETAPSAAPSFATFAELFEAARPRSNSDKALVAGYWLQVGQGAESFSGQSVNNELKHLGEAIANITTAMDGLKNQKPALALQLKKSGKSQQARKSYKVTVAGVKAIEAMLHHG